MLVGINYNTDGTRYISRLDYLASREQHIKRKLAGMMREECDEVYIVDVNNSDTGFIQTIIENGCRI